MPTYGYRCENGHEFEIYQAMSEDPLSRCQVCEEPVRRIFYPVGIVFKGPGFYKTDSRGSSSSTTPAPPPTPPSTSGDQGGEKSDSGTKPDNKSDAKPEKKSESKPAPSSASKKSA